MAISKKGQTESTKSGGKNGKSKTRPPRKPGELSRAQKIVIVIFIVIFAGSTLAGALASVFQSTQSSQDEETQYDVAYVDGRYQDIVSSLESKLEESPEDKATLLALGRYCAQWASGVKSVGTTDEDTTHANELFDRAVGYYDRYLELEDSPAARASRASVLYSKGSTDEAIAALVELTTASPDYAPAWLDLGYMYEDQGRTDEAIAAYQKAVETDADGEYGAASTAQSRITSLQSASEEDSSESGDATGEDASGAEDGASTDSGTDSGTDANASTDSGTDANAGE